MRLGVEPRGIVASGRATSAVRQNTHNRDTTKKALYLHARFDTILEPNAVFPMEFLLNDNFYKKVHWTSQASGMSVPDAVAGKLEKDWAKFINQPVPDRKVDTPMKLMAQNLFTESQPSR